MSGDFTPFKVDVPGEALDDLKKRLELTRFPADLSDSGTALGTRTEVTKKLHDYWLNKYDWRKHESHMNETLPQYTTTIDVTGFGPFKIHLVHQPSTVANAIPLLFCHGWPGSFLEVEKILPDLVKGSKDAPAFHVVAPSLPGYGFSEGATKRGFGHSQCAEVCHKVMQKLGYTQYVTQAGDWGYVITRLMGMHYPQHCKASHFNMFLPNVPKPWSAPGIFARTMLSPWTKEERDGLARLRWFTTDGNAYYKEQSTRPQTLGHSLTDSPIGLLAWIYEKLIEWTDEYPWTEDEILTWVSIYWFSTAGPVSSARLYYEAENCSEWKDPFQHVGGYVPDVKLGMTRFPKEILPLPMKWNPLMGPVAFEKVYTKGGHFAATERPDAIVSDLQEMFGKKSSAYNVVKGKSGFA